MRLPLNIFDINILNYSISDQSSPQSIFKLHYLPYGERIASELAKNAVIAKAVDHLGGRLTVDGGQVPKGIPLPEGVTLNKKVKYNEQIF